MEDQMRDDYILEELLKCKGDIDCINNKLSSLDARGCEFTLEEIGKILNITRERVRQIESSAFKKIKHPEIGKKIVDYLKM
jgi:transcriptional regulator